MDNLDLLISASVGACIEREADSFLSIEVEKITLTERIKRQLEKKCAKIQKGHTRFHPLKVACVACLIVMSLLFTACISIKEIRESIWKVIIEYYDDHMAINFNESGGNNTGTNNNQKPSITEPVDDNKTDSSLDDGSNNDGKTDDTVVDPPIVERPTTIEQKAYLSELPDGYSFDIICDMRSMRMLEYYYLGNVKFTLTQTIMNSDHLYIDNESDIVTEEKVNDHDALLVEYVDETNYYTLTWCDGKYVYTITGNFDDKNILFHLAESLELQ